MLNLIGRGSRFAMECPAAAFCGPALGWGGLTLADVLRSRASAAAPRPATSVIFIEMAGGPSHFETYDPKPTAPAEYRGPLQAIATNLPGVQFSEYMVEQAKIADRLTVLRSIHHRNNSHDTSSHLTQTGYYKTGEKNNGNQMPSFGSIAARFRGPNHPAMPAYVAAPQVMRNGGSAQLGRGYSPFETGSDPNSPGFEVKNLGLLQNLSADRLNDRKTLLSDLEGQRRMLDLSGSSDALDQFTQLSARSGDRFASPRGVRYLARRRGPPRRLRSQHRGPEHCCWPAGWWRRGSLA